MSVFERLSCTYLIGTILEVYLFSRILGKKFCTLQYRPLE